MCESSETGQGCGELEPTTLGLGFGPLSNYDGHIKDTQTVKGEEGLWFHGLTEAFKLIRPEKVKC